MKRFAMLCSGVLLVAHLSAQESVGIGTTTPHTKAILELNSTTKGLLLPRMSSAQRLAIASPPEGLVVYQNTGTSLRGIWYYNGTDWIRMARADELAGGSSSWTVSGNNQYSAVSGNVGIGVSNPLAKLHVVGGPVLFGSGPGDAPVSGGGTRMMWVGNVAAFRAGGVSATQWNDENLGEYSFVAGGYNNIASGEFSFVGGGESNTASHAAFAAGGVENSAIGYTSFVGGGINNTSAPGASYSFIGGGSGNAVSGLRSAVISGTDNRVFGNDVFVGGGNSNEASGAMSVIAGGQENASTAMRAFIGGGWENSTSGDMSFVGGGIFNSTAGQSAFVGGGVANMATGLNAFVGGGNNNTASGARSFIGGGEVNLATGLNAFVGGGNNNTASGTRSFISGGATNLATGANAFIGGGSNLYARSFGEVVFGTYNTDYTPASMTEFQSSDRLFVIGNGTNNANRSNALTVLKNGNIGMGIQSPTSRLHVVGNILQESGNLTINNTSAQIQLRTENVNKGFVQLSGDNLRVGTNSGNSDASLIFRMNGSDRIWILPNGNMGLGVSSPTAQLQLSNTIANRKLVLWETNSNDHQFYGFGINSATLRYQVDQTGADHVFYAGTSSSTSTELLRIKGTGNIRIGSTSPNTHKLNVAGGAVFVGNDELLKFDGTGTSRFIQFYRSGTAKAFIQLQTDDLNIGVQGSGKLFLQGSQITLGTTTAANGYKVSVGGKMICEELRVDLIGNWPDYVFHDDYTLIPLADLKSYISTHGHLPNIPPAEVVENEGFDVGEMNRKLLEKIEELTLYILQQQEQIDVLATEITGLKNSDRKN